jgi:hypothetical protein
LTDPIRAHRLTDARRDAERLRRLSSAMVYEVEPLVALDQVAVPSVATS